MRQHGMLVALALAFAAGAAAQEVTLPLARYEELRERARPLPTLAAVAPAPFALESAQVEIAAGRGSARVTQRITVSLFTDDWVKVPLLPKGSLTSTQLGALDGRIETETGIVLVARGRGRHSLRIEAVVPLAEDETATRATRNGSVALPAAALVTGALLAGAEVEEAEIVGGGMTTAQLSPRRTEFVGTPGGTLFFQLRGAGRPAIARPPAAARLEATSFTLARLARTRSRLEARVALRMTGGDLETATLELPPGFDVVSVSPIEGGWIQDGSRLRITPPAPVGALNLDLVLSGEALTTFAAPLVLPAAAARVRLVSAVHVEADGVATMIEAGSSRRAEPGEAAVAPESVAQLAVPVFVVRDPRQPPRWAVEWSDASALLAAQIDRLQVDALVGSHGRAAYQLWAQVRSSSSTDVVIAPPPGLELVSVERDGVPVVPGSTEHGLVIPLGVGTQVQTIHLSGLLSGVQVPEEGELVLPMPTSTTPIGQVEVRVHLPSGRSYTLANPERAGRLGAPPDVGPPPARSPRSTASGKVAGIDLNALVATNATTPLRRAGTFEAPGDSVLVEARWSALSGNLGPLGIRVKPSREKEEWF